MYRTVSISRFLYLADMEQKKIILLHTCSLYIIFMLIIKYNLPRFDAQAWLEPRRPLGRELREYLLAYLHTP